jgi:hypothetical protein
MNLDLYIDTGRRELVSGPDNSSIVSVPTLSQGNTVTMRIRCLNPTANFPASDPPYTLISTDGRTIQLAVGTKVGNSTTHYVEQYTWDASTADLSDPYWYADVSFNTAAITTLLGSAASTTAWLEVNLVEGVPAGLTPASMEAVLALLKNLTATSIVLQNASDPSKQVLLTVGADGTFQANPVT